MFETKYEVYRETNSYMLAGPGIQFPTVEAAREWCRIEWSGGWDSKHDPIKLLEIERQTYKHGHLISTHVIERYKKKPGWWNHATHIVKYHGQGCSQLNGP